jgi:hypothetical protein
MLVISYESYEIAQVLLAIERVDEMAKIKVSSKLIKNFVVFLLFCSDQSSILCYYIAN